MYIHVHTCTAVAWFYNMYIPFTHPPRTTPPHALPPPSTHVFPNLPPIPPTAIGLLYNNTDHFSAITYFPQQIQPVSLSLPPERGGQRRESLLTPKSPRKRRAETSSVDRSSKVQKVKSIPQQLRKNTNPETNITECTRSMRSLDPQPKVCSEGKTR